MRLANDLRQASGSAAAAGVRLHHGEDRVQVVHPESAPAVHDEDAQSDRDDQEPGQHGDIAPEVVASGRR